MVTHDPAVAVRCAIQLVMRDGRLRPRVEGASAPVRGERRRHRTMSAAVTPTEVPAQGLTIVEARARREKVGPNVVVAERR